ncbi:phosphopantetheine-binding protein [Plantactinospora sp. B5E13]|uniref:acyl carrier protein n=1 Tax=unclassified Plantactinospora TaxID=2631981 RepID=UPI00325F93C9
MEAEMLPSSEPQVVVIVVPEGFRVGPEIRQDVLDVAEDLETPLVVVPTSNIPRRSDGSLDHEAARNLYVNSGYKFTYRRPGSPEEEEVLRIVSELLEESLPGVAVSVTDDLASLGGDSLTALELSDRIHNTFGVVLSAADLYGAQSLAEIAATVRDAKGLMGAG